MRRKPASGVWAWAGEMEKMLDAKYRMQDKRKPEEKILG
jgi:hypothetical protein